MCLIYCSIKKGQCQEKVTYEINLVPRILSYPSLRPSLSLSGTGRRWPWKRGCLRDVLGSLGKSEACIVKKYTHDVISYGSEGLWEGIKETIVFVFGGRYTCVHSIIVLENFPNWGDLYTLPDSFCACATLCRIGLLLSHIRTVISARFLEGL